LPDEEDGGKRTNSIGDIIRSEISILTKQRTKRKYKKMDRCMPARARERAEYTHAQTIESKQLKPAEKKTNVPSDYRISRPSHAFSPTVLSSKRVNHAVATAQYPDLPHAKPTFSPAANTCTL